MRRFWWNVTTPGFGWRYALRTARRDLLIGISRRLPKAVVYWAVVRFVNAATSNGCPDITVMEAMRRNAGWYAE